MGVVGWQPDLAYLVGSRATMSPYSYPAIISFPDVWLDRHNLFALVGLRQSTHLLFGRDAQALEDISLPVRGARCYTFKGGCHPTMPMCSYWTCVQIWSLIPDAIAGVLG